MKLGTELRFRLVTALALVVTIIPFAAFCTEINAQTDTDPNRLPCTTVRCKAIESYVRAHYCGASPARNGPDNGCELLPPKKQPAGVDVLARYHCTYNDQANQEHCVQLGQVPAELRRTLIAQLRNVGLPATATGGFAFTVWRYRSAGWIVADVSYSALAGSKVSLCQVIVRVDKDSHVLILRKCPLITMGADADTPDITEWTLVDVADIEHSGHPDIVLEGDAYEDHWFEVLSVHDGKCETLFSGLGYWL